MFKLLCLAALAVSTHAFSFYTKDELAETLGAGCISALTSDIACDDTVQDFAERKYHGSLESVALTNKVCSGNCYAALKDWFGLVSGECAGETLDGDPAVLMGGYMWEGFNETCVRDLKTKKYCNDIIDQFTTVQRIEEMPKDELCHRCFIRKLAMMQSSQFSAYDQVYKEQLEYVYAHCDTQGPTDIPPSLIPEEVPPTPICVSDNIYTTTGGESCESIANRSSVAGATLYMANQAVLSRCSDLSAGVDLCLPLPCETFYIRPQDTCSSVEAEVGLGSGQLRQYNPWLSTDCTNLQSATDFYGKSVCVSPQGGMFTATRIPTSLTNKADGGDGYTQNVVLPPTGARVARGTTLKCGKWHVVQQSDACSTICIPNHIDIHLFRTVNPSLENGDCTSALVSGSALCVGPVYGWNATATEITSSATMASTPGAR